MKEKEIKIGMLIKDSIANKIGIIIKISTRTTIKEMDKKTYTIYYLNKIKNNSICLIDLTCSESYIQKYTKILL